MSAKRPHVFDVMTSTLLSPSCPRCSCKTTDYRSVNRTFPWHCRLPPTQLPQPDTCQQNNTVPLIWHKSRSHHHHHHHHHPPTTANPTGGSQRVRE